MLVNGIVFVIRFILGLGLVALSIFLMVVKLGGLTFVPGVITLIVFSSAVDMEVLANFWGWDESAVSIFLIIWVGTQIFFCSMESEVVGSVFGGLCGIIAGILTMGVFGTEGAEVLLEIVSVPAVAIFGSLGLIILLFCAFIIFF